LEEEIDLRAYAQVLVRRWKWIAALAVAAAVVALVASFLLPPTYEATALVVITQPRYVMRFDVKFETVNDIQQPYKAYPTLAMSDDLLAQVLAAIDPPLPEGEQDVAAFGKRLDAVSGSDPSVVELRVRRRDAVSAAHIANTWAGVFVKRVNELYAASDQDVNFFAEQLANADVVLAQAERALIEFQGRNLARVLGAQVSAYEEQLGNYLASKNAIELIIQDAAGLKERLRWRKRDVPASLADELAVLYLEIDALSSKEVIPVQLQVTSASSLSGRTAEEQIVFLDGLVSSLQEKLSAFDGKVAQLQPEILRLQGEIQVLEAEGDRLTQVRDVARDTYTTLARKVTEARIAAQDESGEVRLASHAAVPSDPVSPRKGLNTVVAGVLGVVLGVVGAFAIEWWRGTEVAQAGE
jgi:succinoglycan biosynthesis transport protein ExoP